MAAMRFPVPNIEDNPTGWGPSSVPEHLKGVPFAPFNKGDKLGRAADWTQQPFKNYAGRYPQGGGTTVFNFFANEEEDSFHLVDNRPVKTQKYGRGRFQQNRFQRRDQQKQDDMKGKGGRGRDQQGQRKNQWQGFGRDQQRQIQYSSSVDIRPEWAVKEQIPFQSIGKLNCAVGDPEDIVTCGELEYYDKVFDRVTPKTEKPLERTKRAFRNVTTSDDPIIRRLAAEDKAKVFATDTILTTLMTCKSSVLSWDIVITRAGGRLFFDKRDSSNITLLSVNESAPDPIPEDKDSLNGLQQLMLEATTINQNFGQQVLIKTGDKKKFDESNPFSGNDEDEELASVAYRYRKWVLNEEEDVSIIVRCELDGVLNHRGEDNLLSIKALNEFDLRTSDWRKKLDTQRGAVLAFETKNNKVKVAKWTAAALLAGADMIKLGYVSRATPKDNQNHSILGTQICKPREFAAQINLNMDHCWGVVRALVEMLMKMDDGKYLLVKDPNKELLRLYAIPEDAFETHYVEEPLHEEEQAPVELPPAKTEDAVDEV